MNNIDLSIAGQLQCSLNSRYRCKIPVVKIYSNVDCSPRDGDDAEGHEVLVGPGVQLEVQGPEHARGLGGSLGDEQE